MDLPAFTYGTLMSEKVLLIVLGRVPQRTDANLKGYTRAPVRDQCYPAVFKTDASSAVRGKLLLGLSQTELEILDEFEDAAYDRAVVEVETADGTTLGARVWARPDNHVEDLMPGVDWDFERFQRDYEEVYLEKCSMWAAARKSS